MNSRRDLKSVETGSWFHILITRSVIVKIKLYHLTKINFVWFPKWLQLQGHSLLPFVEWEMALFCSQEGYIKSGIHWLPLLFS